MGQGLLVGLEVEMWDLGRLLPCITSCGTLERGWDAVALGMVPSGPHKGTLGSSDIQMVVSTEVLFLAALCSLLSL